MKRYKQLIAIFLVMAVALSAAIPAAAQMRPATDTLEATFTTNISGGHYKFETLSRRYPTLKKTTGKLKLTNYYGSIPPSFTGFIRCEARDALDDRLGYQTTDFDYPYVNTFTETCSYTYNGAGVYAHARVVYNFIGVEIRVDFI
ncbi:MAG: hypothetical protein II756_03945 [Clostridia bacterium]|nr:hypothetical protein [Clostridia bacterium]